MMMSSFETAVTGSVASGVSGRLSASKLNSNALLLHIRRQAQIDAETAMNEQGGALQTSDDELQRAIARREVELLVELVDVMNEQTHVDDEERVDLPPSQKLARRLWFGRRVRDGVYLHEDHRQQVSTFDRARANDAVTHGAVYVSPVRNRNVAANDTDNDSDRSPRSPGRDTSIRVVTTTDVAGATRTRAIPSTVSRRGVLMCPPIPTAKQSQQRHGASGSGKTTCGIAMAAQLTWGVHSAGVWCSLLLIHPWRCATVIDPAQRSAICEVCNVFANVPVQTCLWYYRTCR
jgi:hypothetical protein